MPTTVAIRGRSSPHTDASTQTVSASTSCDTHAPRATNASAFSACAGSSRTISLNKTFGVNPAHGCVAPWTECLHPSCAPMRFATNQYVRFAIHAAAIAAMNPIMPMNNGPPSVRNEMGTMRSRYAS